MPDKTQSVDTLLENYVFMVANQYIDQVDAELQKRLIRLLLEVGQETRQEDQAAQQIVLDHNET
ncbi:hypothetical protein GCM10028807_26780 [Spirosoma daeguense]